MIAELVTVASSALRARTGAPGRQVVSTGKGIGGTSTEAEVYGPCGMFSRPPKGSKVVMVPLGGGRTRVILGSANYQVVIDCVDGQTILYSTDATGKNVKARVDIGADGLIGISNETKSLKVILDSLITHLNGLITTGTAATQTISPATVALLNADKANLALLLKN